MNESTNRTELVKMMFVVVRHTQVCNGAGCFALQIHFARRQQIYNVVKATVVHHIIVVVCVHS